MVNGYADNTGLNRGPLTEEEIEELDHFPLEAEAMEECGWTSQPLDGFLIACGPKAILPSEWLRWV